MRQDETACNWCRPARRPEGEKLLNNLKAGHWLGIDLGSSKKKICSFCLIESDGESRPMVTFEEGIEPAGYPASNSLDALIDKQRQPTYLKAEIEACVGQVLESSELVRTWLTAARGSRLAAVAIDAPVAFAVGPSNYRATEHASTAAFNTPSREAFEALLNGKQKLGTLNSNVFWKCVGFAIYRWLATELAPELPPGFPQETLAAWTCSRPKTNWRVRETFPSDVYKRANSRHAKTGATSQLSEQPYAVLSALVASEVGWSGCNDWSSTVVLRNLRNIKHSLHLDCAGGVGRSCEMRKRTSVTGDLWDAFTCAFTACCEDHGGGHSHGWDGRSVAGEPLRSEGAILTVGNHLVP